MLRLETFGGLRLTDAAGGLVATPRRRLALLALLASAGERGLTRDKLVGVLWPESPGENARHALEQLLYSLRRQFPEEVVLGPDPLRLNPAVITSDVAEFQHALTHGALSAAAGLHRGPFLDGFFLSDAPEFEQWVEAERARLASEHAGALYRLAKDAGSAEHHTVEIDWWRRLATLDPLSERTALGLAQALARAGDWAGALHHAKAYEALVRQELAVPPTPQVTAFIERIRAEHERNARPAAVGLRAPDTPAERYRIERELGHSALATVFLAHDLKHDRLVALKLLRPEVASATETKRFLREISILAGLHHPHILHLYDSGMLALAGRPAAPFFVMPYVRGESLRARLAREVQLPLASALQIACEVADALAYAHGEGVVHRDIKPENILLQEGHALVADFGIARALGSAGGERLSLSGVTLGTPGYMSPEQAGAAQLDGRSDIYSLACVLYEMLAGEPPFTGRTAQIVLARQAADPVPALRTVCPTVPASVERAVMRALAKTPAERFATAAEFASALANR